MQSSAEELIDIINIHKKIANYEYNKTHRIVNPIIYNEISIMCKNQEIDVDKFIQFCFDNINCDFDYVWSDWYLKHKFLKYAIFKYTSLVKFNMSEHEFSELAYERFIM
jgi:hypothetical protein